MLSQTKLGDSMKSMKVLTAVALTTLSLVAVAADKPAETKSAPATTASAPAAKADSKKEKPHPKVITPKEKAAKKAEATTAKK